MTKRLALANGIATALANGPCESSDLAKRREVNGPDLTTPEVILVGATSTSIVTSLTRETPTRWMDAPRFNGGQR